MLERFGSRISGLVLSPSHVLVTEPLSTSQGLWAARWTLEAI